MVYFHKDGDSPNISLDRDWARLGIAHCSKVCVVVPRKSPGSNPVSIRFLCLWPTRSGSTDRLPSVSIGYFPPSRSYEPLESLVKKFPTYKYQLYFSSPTCSMELERNVGTTSMLLLGRDGNLESMHRLQIANFFRYSFHTNVFSGPDGIPENFGDIVTGRTAANVRAGRFLLDRKVDRPSDERRLDGIENQIIAKGTPVHHVSK